MIAVIQRTSSASVTINGGETRSISDGFTVLLGVIKGDTLSDAAVLADKLVNLRVFSDSEGKLNLSLLDIGGEMLIISNFTLGADCRKGRRPSFTDAELPDKAKPLYENFIEICRTLGVHKIETGEFGADMQVKLVNDGPVTIILNSKDLIKGKQS